VAERSDEFRALGVGLIAVSMSRPEWVARYLAERPLPFPVLADPERRGYAALELGRTSVLRWLRPGIAWRYMKGVLRGGKIRRVPEGEDALQTGGDFLIGSDRRLVWEYSSPDPTDRPPVDTLLKVIREQQDIPAPVEKSP
jgi:hypothetical protein